MDIASSNLKVTRKIHYADRKKLGHASQTLWRLNRTIHQELIIQSPKRLFQANTLTLEVLTKF